MKGKTTVWTNMQGSQREVQGQQENDMEDMMERGHDGQKT